MIKSVSTVFAVFVIFVYCNTAAMPLPPEQGAGPTDGATLESSITEEADDTSEENVPGTTESSYQYQDYPDVTDSPNDITTAHDVTSSQSNVTEVVQDSSTSDPEINQNDDSTSAPGMVAGPTDSSEADTSTATDEVVAVSHSPESDAATDSTGLGVTEQATVPEADTFTDETDVGTVADATDVPDGQANTEDVITEMSEAENVPSEASGSPVNDDPSTELPDVASSDPPEATVVDDGNTEIPEAENVPSEAPESPINDDASTEMPDVASVDPHEATVADDAITELPDDENVPSDASEGHKAVSDANTELPEAENVPSSPPAMNDAITEAPDDENVPSDPTEDSAINANTELSQTVNPVSEDDYGDGYGGMDETNGGFTESENNQPDPTDEDGAMNAASTGAGVPFTEDPSDLYDEHGPSASSETHEVDENMDDGNEGVSEDDTAMSLVPGDVTHGQTDQDDEMVTSDSPGSSEDEQKEVTKKVTSEITSTVTTTETAQLRGATETAAPDLQPTSPVPGVSLRLLGYIRRVLEGLSVSGDEAEEVDPSKSKLSRIPFDPHSDLGIYLTENMNLHIRN